MNEHLGSPLVFLDYPLGQGCTPSTDILLCFQDVSLPSINRHTARVRSGEEHHLPDGGKRGFLVSNLVTVDFAHIYIWLLIMEIVIIWAILLEKISIITVCTKLLKHQLIFYILMYTHRHTLNISSFKNKDASNHLFKSCTWSPHLPRSIGDSHLHPFEFSYPRVSPWGTHRTPGPRRT